jgi:hypothetical protein
MRRLALLSLTAAGVIASAAFAQEQPAPPPQPAPPAPEAPVAPTPPAAAEMPAAEPATEVPLAEEAPPPPPPTPTDVTSLAVLNVLERVCNPMVRGGNIAQLAPSLGFKKKRDVWIWQYQKGFQIAIQPSTTNPNVCTMDLAHPVETVAPAATLATDLHYWAQARGWGLARFDRYVTDMERTTRSWELITDIETEALVLMTARKVNGAPVTPKADHTQVLFTIRQN